MCCLGSDFGALEFEIRGLLLFFVLKLRRITNCFFTFLLILLLGVLCLDFLDATQVPHCSPVRKCVMQGVEDLVYIFVCTSAFAQRHKLYSRGRVNSLFVKV